MLLNNFDVLMPISRQAVLELINNYLHDVNAEKIFTVSYIEINGTSDESGGSVGDELTLKIVNVIKNAIRHTDTFIRISDSGFILVFSGCAKEVVSDIMVTIKKKIDFLNAESPYDNSIKYGILEVNDNTNIDAEKLIQEVINNKV